jgi:uncharacterized SAM-binding protein YcdF (DUF218 family)
VTYSAFGRKTKEKEKERETEKTNNSRLTNYKLPITNYHLPITLFMRRILIRSLVSILLLWLLSLSLIDAYGLQDQARPADAIVILGTQVYPGSIPGPALTRRTRHAAALYYLGLAPTIICSGGQAGPETSTEAAAACKLAATLGVPPAALVLEDRSRSTEENALDTAAIMASHGWRTIVVVSDGYHLYRAELLFRRAGLVPFPSPAQVTTGPMNPIERYGRETRELAALVWYWSKAALGLKVTDFP